MSKKSRGRSQKNEINAGSMADIAFLLLIFFLVTTTIVEEEGILVKLPPFSIDIEPTPLPPRNVFTVKVNSSNLVLAESEIIKLSDLKDAAKLFISNPDGSDQRPSRPNKAIISLQNDRGTDYETYITVYNELQSAYRELREEAAQLKYQTSFLFLSKEKQKEIRNEIPLVISEADPTEF